MSFPLEIRSVVSAINTPPAGRLVTAWVGRLGEDAFVIQTADCIPLVIYDPFTKLTALLHLGWRDIVAGRVRWAYRQLKKSGANLDHTQVYLGPAICANCYHDRGLKALIKGTLFKLVGLSLAVDERPDNTHFNLRQAAIVELLKYGIESAAIEVSLGCTYEDKLPSRRRDGKGKNQLFTIVKDKC